MSLEPGMRLGPYEVLAPLGAGGMGEVYRARDHRLRRDVAIKVLPASFTQDADRVARFEREARLLAALNCSNIASIYGIEHVGETRGLVLELVEGPTLAEQLRIGRLPVHDVLAIARQIVDALDAAHGKGIIHRDLKPSNIKISPEGTVKVLDFGLAKDADDRATSDSSQTPTVTAVGTQAGVILGTAAYMSPEQARGRVVDKRTDIWAFGCVLYEMLVGRPPFTGETVSDIIARILGSETDWGALPAETPSSVRRLLPRLLEKDLRRRVRDIADARFDLEDALSGHQPVPVLSAHRWRAVAITALAALALLAAGVILVSRIFTPPREAGSGISRVGETIVSQLTNYDGSEASGAIAPDGRSFAFVSGHGGTPDIWLRQIHGGEPVRLTNDAAAESGLEFAPDGESIYFARVDGSDTSIWRIGALGGQARRVLNDARFPTPSRDGRYLAWLSPEGPNGSSLGICAADGSGRRILVQDIQAVSRFAYARAAWSPDGRRLAYTSGLLFAPSNLYVVDVADRRVRQVTRFDKSTQGTRSQAWLPDNRHLVIAYNVSPRAQGAADLGILDVETGSIERVTTSIADSFSEPSLSSDGTRMIVIASRPLREVWKVPFGPDPMINGRGAVRLLDASLDPMWVYVTRDGRTILFNNALVGSRNLWTMQLDGRARPRQITAVAGDAVMHSALSPDGVHVAFTSSATGNSDVWVQNVDGSDLRQLTSDPAADAWPVWSPDGRSIIFASLREGVWETRRVPAGGGTAEKVVDGFFRGDWIQKPDGAGTWIVTAILGRGLRLLDGESRAVMWQDRKRVPSLPMFSPDAKLVSISYPENHDRDAIWVYDVATGQARVAVQFSQPFHIPYRASWVDGGRSFIVNRLESSSHIVMFDRFWLSH